MQRLKDLDTLKIIGILLVVFGHVTMVYTSRDIISRNVSIPAMKWITDYIYMFHMPAFVASSGAIYYFGKRVKGKYEDQLSFIKGKMLRLIVPYFFFVTFVMLPIRIYVGVEDSIINFFIKFVLLIIGPHHLWYVIMIFNVYVVFNTFENLIYENHLLKVLAFFLLGNILSEIVPNVFQIGNTLRYLFYFYIGYCFLRYREKIRIPKNKIAGIAVLFILSLFFMSGIQWAKVSHNGLILYIFQLGGAITGLSMLYYLSEYFSNLTIMDNKIIKKIGMDSFGIYLFHQGIIYLVIFWSRNLSMNPYLYTILLFIITIILSIFLTDIFRNMGWNILIGESRKKHKRF